MRKYLFVILMTMASHVTFAQEDNFVLLPSFPNPFTGTTTVYLVTEYDGEVWLVVSDIYGRYQARWLEPLVAGVHHFQITLHKEGLYVLGAQQKGRQASILLSCEEGGFSNSIVYLGWTDQLPEETFRSNQKKGYFCNPKLQHKTTTQ